VIGEWFWRHLGIVRHVVVVKGCLQQRDTFVIMLLDADGMSLGQVANMQEESVDDGFFGLVGGLECSILLLELGDFALALFQAATNSTGLGAFAFEFAFHDWKMMLLQKWFDTDNRSSNGR
jgi:hypothetical protein